MAKRGDSTTDSWFAWGLGALLWLLVALPTGYALWQAYRLDLAWKGLIVFSPGDLAVYLSYITQGADGHLLFTNLFDTSAQAPTLHGLWLLVGWLSRALSIGPLAAYQLARLLLVPVLAWVAWRFIKDLVPAEHRQRTIAYGLVLFAGGIGTYTHLWKLPTDINSPILRRPIDLWVTEAFPFLSSIYSPHFVAAWILFLLTAWLLWRSFLTGQRRPAVLAGLCVLGLTTFHPYHAISLTVIPIAWLAFQEWRGQATAAGWRCLGYYLAIISPAVLFHGYRMVFSPESAMMARRSLALMPDLPYFLLGYGCLLPLAFLGWRAAAKLGWKDDAHLYLAVWATAQAFAIYGPFLASRRLLLGWQFPVAVLSAPGLIWLSQRLRPTARQWLKRYPVAIWLTALLFLFNMPFITLATVQVTYSSPESRDTFYFTPEYYRTISWIRDQTPTEAVFISLPTAGHHIGGWAHRRVYVGHWANTDRIDEKTEAAVSFFNDMTHADRLRLIAENGVTHIWCGPSENQLSGGHCPAIGLKTVEAYRSPNYSIHEIIER